MSDLATQLPRELLHHIFALSAEPIATFESLARAREARSTLDAALVCRNLAAARQPRNGAARVCEATMDPAADGQLSLALLRWCYNNVPRHRHGG